MAKYKRKKTNTDPDSNAPTIESKNSKSRVVQRQTDSQKDAAAKSVERPKKLSPGSVKLMIAGDIVLVKKPQGEVGGLVKRFSALFEHLANMDKDQRFIVYRFISGLLLTSLARHSEDLSEKKKLFDQKNQVYLNLANDRSLRRLFDFNYLVSKNFRVLNFCEKCQRANEASEKPRHKWKYCKECKVDHDFFNLLSMESKFVQGFCRLFISNDQVANIPGFRIRRKSKIGQIEEEAMFDRYHYNSKTLSLIDRASALAFIERFRK